MCSKSHLWVSTPNEFKTTVCFSSISHLTHLNQLLVRPLATMELRDRDREERERERERDRYKYIYIYAVKLKTGPRFGVL